MNIVLDSNIFDLLAIDADCLSNLNSLIDGQRWKVLAPATLLEELEASPFKGVPTWLTVEVGLDEVFILDHTKLGSGKLGHGGIFSEHKGESNNVKDAVIVDYAVKKADIFVSEDRRARNRLNNMQTSTRAYTYLEFKNLTNQAIGTPQCGAPS